MPGPGGPTAQLVDALVYGQMASPPPETMRSVGLPNFFGQIAAGGGGGVPAQGMFGGSAAMPYADPANWGMAPSDFDSPLAYTKGPASVGGGNPYEPRDTGGYF